MANPTTVVHIYPPISGRVMALKVLPGQEVSEGAGRSARCRALTCSRPGGLRKGQDRSGPRRHAVESCKRAAAARGDGAEGLRRSRKRSMRPITPNWPARSADAAYSRLQGDRHYGPDSRSGRPFSGVVLDVGTATGELQRSLDNATPIATIANISDVWVVADLYPRDVQAVRRGQPVEIHVNGYPDTTFHGVDRQYLRRGRSTTLTLKVRVVLPNPHHS